MKLTLNISTCPNDTFMFDAMIHHRIDTEGLTFDVHLADIEELNRAAIEGTPDISKLSYASVPLVLDRYRILNSGSALGRGNGPLLVSRTPMDKTSLQGKRVAVPGTHTTANLLMNKIFPSVTDKPALLFSSIAPAISEGRCDAGVLIHEGRFVYEQLGLHLIADLGQEWERLTALPLPLGAIVVSRQLSPQMQQRIDRVLSRSIRYAFEHPSASADFVRLYAQELSDEVTKQHIQLFVNEFSIDLGDEGRRAVTELLGIENNGEVFV